VTQDFHFGNLLFPLARFGSYHVEDETLYLLPHGDVHAPQRRPVRAPQGEHRVALAVLLDVLGRAGQVFPLDAQRLGGLRLGGHGRGVPDERPDGQEAPDNSRQLHRADPRLNESMGVDGLP
jgi:hypothetical protein